MDRDAVARIFIDNVKETPSFGKEGWGGFVLDATLRPFDVMHRVFELRCAPSLHTECIFLNMAQSQDRTDRFSYTKAWYSDSRERFLAESPDNVVGHLARSAIEQGLHIEFSQKEEWDSSIRVLQGKVKANQDILRRALANPQLAEFADVILEYDFRRRGLRIDAILLAPGLIVVLEFKRSSLTAGDRDQVTNYAINLLEFHEETRRVCGEGAVVAPVLSLTRGKVAGLGEHSEAFHAEPWGSVIKEPVQTDAATLDQGLLRTLGLRRSLVPIPGADWLRSRFSPSSTIIDAALSLFANHDVSAIRGHASSVERIDGCVEEVRRHIREAKLEQRNRIVLISGAPGSGKTLVGLKLAYDSEFRSDAVLVTGNAPLVDVLSAALKGSYSKKGLVATGYPRESASRVVGMSDFKLVKAHHFLGERGKKTASSDGHIVIFDEAQRTYEKGRYVVGKPLPDHEADLILAALEDSYEPGAVVVALLGHNQAINQGERGAIAWFEAAERRNWDLAISDQTLELSEFDSLRQYASRPNRRSLSIGHLSTSMRFYRNSALEEWAHWVMEGDAENAAATAQNLDSQGHSIMLTRDLEAAKHWARKQRIAEERAGMIASGQARRLAAEGLFVSLKPNIAQWMLAPSGDVRSSNMLETVQNQYQIQGLELDYTIVCWDLDLRRQKSSWEARKLRGSSWQRDRALHIAKNTYRVLLTRARKGMIIFVPRGDLTGDDPTRPQEFYDAIANYLVHCGARSL